MTDTNKNTYPEQIKRATYRSFFWLLKNSQARLNKTPDEHQTIQHTAKKITDNRNTFLTG